MESDQGKLFVGGISRETSEETLKEHFGKYGTVLSSVVARDRNTKSPRGFGFVLFCEPFSADKALQDTHVILGRTVEVKRAIPRSEQQQQQQQQHNNNSQQRSGGLSNNSSSGDGNNQFRTKKIFVGGLSASLTEEEFRNYFERFGRITDVVVMHDSMTNRPRGFGFVTFDSEESVENVMQNHYHELNSRYVEVKRAVPKEGINGINNGHNTKAGVGRGSYSSFPPFEYLPTGSAYGVFPTYAPLPGYNCVGGYYYGTNVYGCGYPALGYGRTGYGLNPVAPRAPLLGPVMPGAKVWPVPYGAASIYPPYMNGEVGVNIMGTVAGAHNGVVRPGADWNLEQVPDANGIMSPKTEVKSEIENSNLKKVSGDASKQRGRDGQHKPLPVDSSR